MPPTGVGLPVRVPVLSTAVSPRVSVTADVQAPSRATTETLGAKLVSHPTRISAVIKSMFVSLHFSSFLFCERAVRSSSSMQGHQQLRRQPRPHRHFHLPFHARHHTPPATHAREVRRRVPRATMSCAALTRLHAVALTRLHVEALTLLHVEERKPRNEGWCEWHARPSPRAIAIALGSGLVDHASNALAEHIRQPVCSPSTEFV